MEFIRTFRSALIVPIILVELFSTGCPMEKSFIFFPEKEIVETPADAGLAFDDVYLKTSDGVKINGWFVPSAGSRTTLLWFHGNAGNIGHRVDPIRRLHDALNVNILMIDYREYGKSNGEVSEEGTYRDAIAAYDYLLTRSDVDPKRIVLFGQSLGAGVAVELALKRKAAGLILEAPFTSIAAMAKAAFPWLPIGGLLSTRYDNLSKIARVNVPLLILQGDRDEVVPYAQGRQLFEAAKEPKTFYTIQGAGHNDTYLIGGEPYHRALFRFIERLH
ncbi:MAG TPA: alpha/beta hydrolase [Nitrospiria bacterium]|nr:alpha/beta hydrolase [Nitrospiria bacterium]